jgi:hypothetical protein
MKSFIISSKQQPAAQPATNKSGSRQASQPASQRKLGGRAIKRQPRPPCAAPPQLQSNSILARQRHAMNTTPLAERRMALKRLKAEAYAKAFAAPAVAGRLPEAAREKVARRQKLGLPATATEAQCEAAEKAARKKAAKENEAREMAAREKAAREKVAREKAAREKAAKEKATARRQKLGLPATATEAQCEAAEQAAREKAAGEKAAGEKAAKAAKAEREAEEKAREAIRWCVKGAFAKQGSKVGEVTMDPNSDQEVKVRWADGKESGYIKAVLLSKASTHDQKAAAAWCTAGTHAWYDGKIGTIKAAPNSDAEVKLVWRRQEWNGECHRWESEWYAP